MYKINIFKKRRPERIRSTKKKVEEKGKEEPAGEGEEEEEEEERWIAIE